MLHVASNFLGLSGDNLEAVAVIAAVVGGLGSAAGGIFAWRAAVASRDTAREARSALAHAIAPDPSIELPVYASDDERRSANAQTLHARIVNLDRWAAADLELRVTFADGTTQRHHREQLAPFAPNGDDWTPALRPLTDAWPPADGERLELALRFADAQRVARYETAFPATVAATGASGMNAVRVDGEQQSARRL